MLTALLSISGLIVSAIDSSIPGLAAVAIERLSDSCHIGSPCLCKLCEVFRHRPIIGDRIHSIREVRSGCLDLIKHRIIPVLGRCNNVLMRSSDIAGETLHILNTRSRLDVRIAS